MGYRKPTLGAPTLALRAAGWWGTCRSLLTIAIMTSAPIRTLPIDQRFPLLRVRQHVGTLAYPTRSTSKWKSSSKRRR